VEQHMAPGYLMLFPLLGDAVDRRWRSSPATRAWLATTAVVVLVGVTLVASEVRFNWLPSTFENFALGADPDLAAVDWISLRTDLAARGLLGRPGLIVAATRWLDAGKVDYALEGRMTVICLGDDPRQYGLTTRIGEYAGDDVLIVAPRVSFAEIGRQFGKMFDSLEELPPETMLHAGRPAMLLPLYLGHRLHGVP